MSGVLITQEERAKYRAVLSNLKKLQQPLLDHLREGKPIAPQIGAILVEMSGTVEPQGQLKALEAMLAEVDRQYDEQLRYAAQFKFSPFCEYMRREEVPAHHQEFLIDHMEMVHRREITRLAISLPPGSAKTTYASHRFPAWHLGLRPNDRWLQGAHTQTFAKDRLGKVVRNLMQESRYLEVFPDMRLSQSSAAADYFEFQGGTGYYKAIGVGQGISGFRADIGGIDDPIASREDAESPTMRRKLHEWFEDDFGTRPMPGSPIYVVATRWHEDDLIGHELQKMDEGKGEPWHVINIPALAGPNDPLGRPEGEGLWEGVFGTEFYLKQKRNLTGRSWNSLYQGNPVDEEGGVLKRSDVDPHRYKTAPKNEYRNGKLVKTNVRRVTLSVDCAEKATQRSDYTAATVWAEDTNGRHYLIHAARTRKEFVDMCQWIEELADTWEVDQILVEDRGAGTQYIQVREKSPGRFPVIPIQTKQQSKDFRFDGVTPMFAAGTARIPETGTDWIADVEAELFAFPAGKNDDYVDSVSQYLAWARERSGHRRGVRKMKGSQHA
ncbi:terminase large subunit [Ruegeria phage RpAliso]|nr:terminase large subunit [Ruegeria phage RpAliso]